jgi:hypothetical protein
MTKGLKAGPFAQPNFVRTEALGAMMSDWEWFGRGGEP